MIKRRAFLVTFLPIVFVSLLASAQERVPEIAIDDFARLQAAIRPLPGQSRWREVPWVTNITHARNRSLAEDKPILIFTAADGSPLART